MLDPKKKAIITGLRKVYKQQKEFSKRRNRLAHVLSTGINLYAFMELSQIHAKSVLEIGFGVPKLLSKLSRFPAFKSTQLYGIDVRPMNVEKAKKYSTSKLKFAEGTCYSIPFKTKFDLIFTTLSFHGWSKKDEGVKNVLNRLNRNGKFIIYDVSLAKFNPKAQKYLGFSVKVNRYPPLIKVTFEKKK